MWARALFTSVGLATLTSVAAACGGDAFSAGSDTDAGGDATSSGTDAFSGPDAPKPPPPSDGGPPPDAPLVVDAPPPFCADAGPFPTFDKACTTDLGCAFQLHRTDCCGNQLAIGMNHAEVTAFSAAETQWENECPVSCSCPAAIHAEDGKTAASAALVKVACIAGMGCMTSVP